ncbi:MAG: hypothetical protein B7Y17_03550 [Sulfuricurvum sp. 24-42-5]|jgi:hypothetical protein|nr:MAG: hypothetical protein B7Y17_03550 [Sulfuricurvum sp. 24-42-5]
MWYLIDVRVMGFSNLYSIMASNEEEAIERLKIHVPSLTQGIGKVFSIQIDPAQSMDKKA